MVEHALEVSFAGPSHVGMGGSGACVVFGYHVSVVSPGVLEVDDQNRLSLDVVSGHQDGRRPNCLFDADSYTFEHGGEGLIGYFGLDQVGPIEVVQTVDSDDSSLERGDSVGGGVFRVVLEVFDDRLQFLGYEVVASLELLSLGSAVHIEVFIPKVFNLGILDQLFVVVGQLVFSLPVQAQQIHDQHFFIVPHQLLNVPLEHLLVLLHVRLDHHCLV